MKIQCDVCNKEEATVFCAADEASLCDACDHRIHHANKLASKHQRFILLHPCSSKQVPLCDICQVLSEAFFVIIFILVLNFVEIGVLFLSEKQAFLFCQQDRAILCRDCDFPIHSANEHTQKHNRFLLTGVKLSSTSAIYTPSNSSDSVPEFKSQSSMKNPVSSSSNFNQSATAAAAALVNKSNGENNLLANEGDGSTSSISKYLIEILPGWHVEDFLDSCGHPFGFCKSDDDGLLPFFDTDLESNMTTSSQESLGLWVPQSPSPLYLPQYSSQIGGSIGFKETKETTSMKANKGWTNDSFTVPQISPPAIGSKRSKPL